MIESADEDIRSHNCIPNVQEATRKIKNVDVYKRSLMIENKQLTERGGWGMGWMGDGY